MGIDHSLKAAGTAGFGTPWPLEYALEASVSFQLPAMASARRTRMSFSGSRSYFIHVMPPKPTVNVAVCRRGRRWRAMSRSSWRTIIPYSGAKS
jgi:hypothetical protein